MKLYLIVFLAIILFTVHQQVYAHGHHDTDYNGGTTIQTITTIEENKGVATAIATGQCHFDYSYALQGCASIGSYDGDQAFAIGLGKRANDLLFTGTLSIESGGLFSGGASVNIKFK